MLRSIARLDMNLFVVFRGEMDALFSSAPLPDELDIVGESTGTASASAEVADIGWLPSTEVGVLATMEVEMPLDAEQEAGEPVVPRFWMLCRRACSYTWW